MLAEAPSTIEVTRMEGVENSFAGKTRPNNQSLCRDEEVAASGGCSVGQHHATRFLSSLFLWRIQPVSNKSLSADFYFAIRLKPKL